MSAGPEVEVRPEGDLGIVEPTVSMQPRLWGPDRLSPGQELALVHDPQHPHSEAIRTLRTRLLLMRDTACATSTFTVVSPSPHEGRSRLCAELAIAFAQLGRPTLLIDADLRRPRQHLMFRGSNLSGLAQALHRNEAPWIHSVWGIPHLALLTSGGTPENALELLSGGRFEQLVVACRRDFEFIVIDTPPATRYSDALAITGSGGGRAVVVTRASETAFDDLAALMRQLAATSTRVVGAVINRF